ncbi:hypothetical protein [Streptomyces sp. NPDC001450]
MDTQEAAERFVRVWERVTGVRFRFDEEGRVAKTRDHWHTAEDHQEPASRLFFLRCPLLP